MTTSTHANDPTPPTSTVPPLFWAVAAPGVVWNAYGVYQFLRAVLATRDSLMAMGMGEAQAQTMTTYPLWMTIAFAVGTLGGLIGCILLVMRRKWATPVFAASLIGYVGLYIGDITEGIFAVMGRGQVVILTVVVAIAAGLLLTSRGADRRGLLT